MIALMVECDDWTEANGVTEFWGEDDERGKWRVSVADAPKGWL
jgi:hypothetical protein